MGATKTENFSRRQRDLARLAKAIAHPARIAILEVLINRSSCICGDIVDELPLSQATVSQHLKELKEAGIIRGEIDGVRVCYCINPDVWKDAKQMMNGLFDDYKGPIDCC